MSEHGPLHGNLVVEFGNLIAAPYATMLLADLGARVVKVEPTTGDLGRQFGPYQNGESVFFMTISEAARLVLQAAAIGESGQVLVLDMGEPVRITDLARDLIRMAGHAPDEIAIEFTGLRPGEKLYEELLADEDATLPTAVPRLRIARLNAEPARLDELLALAASTGATPPDGAVRDALERVVPGYRRDGRLA